MSVSVLVRDLETTRRERRIAKRLSVSTFFAYLVIAISTLGAAIALSEGARHAESMIFDAAPVGVAIVLAMALISVAYRGSTKPGLLLLIFAYLAAGLPGVYFSHDQDALPGLVTGGLLLLKAGILLVLIPAHPDVKLENLPRIILFWFFLACLFLSVESLVYSLQQGVSFGSQTRLNGTDETTSEKWLQANGIGLYSALLMATSLLLRMKWYVRWPSFLLGFYVLVLSQSRGSMFALGVALAIFFVIRWQEIKLKWSVFLLVPLGLFILGNPGCDRQVQSLENIGPIYRVIKRTQISVDSGRSPRIARAFERASKRPLWGYGYKGGSLEYRARTTFVEDTVASTMLEAGAMGLALYVLVSVACLSVFLQSLINYRRAKLPPSQQGYVLMAEAGTMFWAFMITRGFVERSTITMLTDGFSNTMLLMLGCLCFSPLFRIELHAPTRYDFPLPSLPPRQPSRPS